MEFNYERKYITTDGKEHKEIQEKEKKQRYEMPYLAFGELCVDENLRKKIKEDVYKIEDYEERWSHIYRISETDTLDEIRKHIASMEPEDDFIENFVYEASDNPKIKDQVPFNLPYFAEWMAKNSLNKEIISNSLLKEILRFHVEEYKKEAEIFDRKVKEAKADFLKYLTESIKKGKLPSLSNIDEIESRVNDIEVQLQENLYPFFSQIAIIVDEGIIYNWDYIDKSEDFIKRVLFHELVHVSAGKMIKKIPDPEREGSMSYEKRSGFAVTDVVFLSDKRIWMTEGVTEMITKIISDQAGLKNDLTNAYAYEQKAIEELIEKGVPREYFIEAFFENYNEEIKGMPKWKRLIQKIHEVDSGGFLRIIKEKKEKLKLKRNTRSI